MTQPQIVHVAPDTYRVEQFDDDGGCQMATFTGRCAKSCAERYMYWLRQVELEKTVRGSWRQAQLLLQTPAEAAIRNAVIEVERLGASELLTAAVTHLADAQRIVGAVQDDNMSKALSDGN